jgi:serine/threonine-protein kinase
VAPETDLLQRAQALLHAALERPASERAAFLSDSCGADAALHREVTSLVAAHDAAGGYFEALSDQIAQSLEFEVARQDERRIGPYRTLRLLGRGGMGAVYLAERADGQFDQQVALKVMGLGLDGPEARRRFLAERQIVARLSHPSIARLLDGGLTDDGQPYFVMEFVDGQPLTAYAAAADLPLGARLDMVMTVAEAVQYAHENLVIHRDVKPSNVLVTRAGAVKLVDFGIAKLLDDGGEAAGDPPTRTADRLLSLPYAAPEQVRGGAVTTATDVYAIGVVLYELLTGRRPHVAADASELERAILEREPPRPSDVAPRWRRQLSGDLDTVCLKALRKEPDRRYRTAAQLADDLQRHARGLPVAAQPDTVGYRARKFVRRHAVGVASSAAILVLLATLTVTTLFQAARTARERDKAQEVASLLVELFAVADPSEARGATITAKEVLDRGVARIQSELGSQPELKATLLGVMGRVYQNLGSYQAAAPLVESALALRREAGPDDPEVVAGLNALGELQRLRGDYKAAEATLSEALALSTRVHGREAPDTARALNHLSKVQIATGRAADAEASARRALAVTRAALGPAHADIAESLMNLAAALFTRGDDRQAEPLFREALAMRREVLGPDHPSVPAGLNNLAALLSRKGDFAAAETAHREALDIYRRLLGAEHPRVATSLNNLGLALLARGDLPGAEEALRASLAQRRKLLPPAHPETAQSLANLGLVLQSRRAYEEAESSYQEALAIRQQALGPAHTLVGQTLNNLALLHQARGDFGRAEPLFRQALAILRQALGPAHPLVGTGLHNLGALLAATGNGAQARPAFEEALAIRRKALPPGHPEILLTAAAFGLLLADGGEAREAAPFLEEVARARETAGQPLDARLRAALVRTYDALGQPDKARPYR